MIERDWWVPMVVGGLIGMILSLSATRWPAQAGPPQPAPVSVAWETVLNVQNGGRDMARISRTTILEGWLVVVDGGTDHGTAAVVVSDQLHVWPAGEPERR